MQLKLKLIYKLLFDRHINRYWWFENKFFNNVFWGVEDESEVRFLAVGSRFWEIIIFNVLDKLVHKIRNKRIRMSDLVMLPYVSREMMQCTRLMHSVN